MCDLTYGDGVDRFLLTPRWLALHLGTVAALVVFVILGWWQFGVYHDSQSRQDVRDLAPVPVADLAEPDEPLGDAADRQANVEGRYLVDQQLLVPGRLHQDVLGSYVVAALRTDDGVIVPVLRGWVDEPDDPAAEVPQGTVSVTGFLLPPETSDHATVRSDLPLDAGELAYIAPDQLAEHRGYQAAATLRGYLLLQNEVPEPAVAPAALDIDAVAAIRDVSPWQNLSYWAQWWVFAAAAIVFWASAVRSAVRSRRNAVSEPAPSRVPS